MLRAGEFKFPMALTLRYQSGPGQAVPCHMFIPIFYIQCLLLKFRRRQLASHFINALLPLSVSLSLSLSTFLNHSPTGFTHFKNILKSIASQAAAVASGKWPPASVVENLLISFTFLANAQVFFVFNRNQSEYLFTALLILVSAFAICLAQINICMYIRLFFNPPCDERLYLVQHDVSVIY